jgi:hypothetical protein
VDVDVRPHLDFLDLDRLLLLASLGGFLLGLVFVPAKVEDLGDGRDGIRRDFHEVQTGLSGHLKGPLDRNGAEIGAFAVDQLDLGDTNLLVDARAVLGNGRRRSVGSTNGGSLLLLLKQRNCTQPVRRGTPTKESGNPAPKSTDSSDGKRLHMWQHRSGRKR